MTTWADTVPGGVENTFDITSSTDIRSVSEMLDAVYLADTPFVNKVGYGASQSNTTIEWVTDSIGNGYLIASDGIASNVTNFVAATGNNGAVSLSIRQIHTGTVLKYNGNTSKDMGYLIVQDLSTGGGSVVFAWLSGTQASGVVALTTGATLFIVGSPAPQGSTPRNDTTRPRSLASNTMQIFRQDIRMTGTRMALDMYSVANELRKQIELRTKEYKREVERTIILGKADAGSATETQLMNGIMQYLYTQSGDHIDTSTTTLTEAAILTVAAGIYDNGGEANTLLISPSQARVISTFDKAKVRQERDSRIAGFYTNKLETDLGVEIEILISRWCPKNFAFVLDTNQINIVPYANRKFNLQKLGAKGDYVEYQLISEISLEMKGYSLGQHGMFTALA